MQLRRLTTINMSITARDAPEQHLRPCQRAYLGSSNARRMLKRAQLTKKSSDDPIFALHEEAAVEAAAVTPFETNPPGYSVQCYATHTEDERLRKEAEAAEREKRVLFASINSSRHAEKAHALRLHPLLCKYAQDHADLLFNEETYYSSSSSPGSSSSSMITSSNQVVVVMSPSGARVARLVSPPRLGALACGEMWYGGKYKRHLYSVTTAGAGAGDGGEHPEDCPCHLRIVFETMVDEGWNAMGIGKGEDGRWVVELAQ